MGRFLIAACLAALASLVAIPVADANICTSAAGCEFWDDQHHEYILYNVDTADIDVLIVPPASGFALMDLNAIEQSVADWDAGINAKGPAWLGAGITINSYTLGIDTPPQAALLDPEIIIWTANTNPFVSAGIGEQVPISICRQQSAAAHLHPEFDWVLQQTACEDGGAQCHVIQSQFAAGWARDMYDLNSHEFGHCLGIGHVGDALDFDAKTVPMSDIMSYQHAANVHCVSSLNILALQGVYATLLGQPGQLNAGAYVTASPASYSQATCTNPSEDLLAGLSFEVDPEQPFERVEDLGVPEELGIPAIEAWDPVELLADTPLAGFL